MSVSCLGELLYFPQKQFSPRFGDKFFTVYIRDHAIRGSDSACGGRFAVYKLEVCRGREKWYIYRRYSEFDKMRKELSDEIPANVETLPSLPPKTCFRAVDEVGGAVYALYRN
mmetsp:Transcript_17216/g.25758  ORF Transcript_17216/g.25758 Transcript_17216/m.25758 type:complete len:113 (+) Transcript_17216:248-586(+)